jgi:hypothetical protein
MWDILLSVREILYVQCADVERCTVCTLGRCIVICCLICGQLIRDILYVQRTDFE